MKRRTALLQQIASGTQRRLPKEYLEVEYIESTGEQWIDTEYKPNNNTRYKMKAYMTTNATWFFGKDIVWDNNGFGLSYLVSSNALGFYLNKYHGYTKQLSGDIIAEYNEAGNLIINNDNLNVQQETITEDYNLYLFTINRSGSVNPGDTSSFKLYYFELYDNDVLVHDFIPVLRKADNKPGLYDLVTQQFFVNQGTGDDFLFPTEGLIPRLPNEYQEVEYIESSGEQLIDSGVIGNQDFKVELLFNYTTIPVPGVGRYIFGASNGENNRSFIISCLNATNNPYFAHFDTVNGTYVEQVIPTLNKTKLELSKNGLYIDNILSQTYNNSVNFTTPDNLLIFGGKYNSHITHYGMIKLYSCKLWDNTTLVRDFVPCYRISDDKPGLYDLVNDVFYINQGTGTDFTVGPNHDTYIKSTIEIPYYGNTTLSSNWLNVILNTIPSENRSYINKIIIPTSYIDINVLWSYDFSNFPNATIYYGDSPVDYSVFTIRGSGALTSEIVDSQIGSIRSDLVDSVTKVVVPATFTAVSDNPLNALSSLPNLANIEINDNISAGDYGFDIINFGSTLFGSDNNYNVKLNIVRENRRTSLSNSFYANWLEIEGYYYFQDVYANQLNPRCNIKINSSRQPFTPNTLRVFYSNKVIIGNTNRGYEYQYGKSGIGNFQHYADNPKLYFEKGDTSTKYLTNSGNKFRSNQKIYFSANELEYYMTETNWSNFNSKFIGFLDYTDTIPTFSGYTDTWYEDEDCTTPIATTDFVSGNRYYVKLIAI